jgi:hypothetical protein
VFLVSCFESTIFGVGERSSTFSPSFLEKRGAVAEGRAHVAGEMRTSVGIVPLVGIRKIGAEAGGELVRSCTMNEKNVPVFAERS